MVIADASLARLGSGLRKKFAFFPTPPDAAASTPDPSDTGVDLKRRGRVAGYIRGRNAPGAFSRCAPKGLLGVATSVSLWRNAQSAAASIERDIADFKRFRGKAIEGGLLVSFAVTEVPSLGDGAALLYTHSSEGWNRSLHHVGCISCPVAPRERGRRPR